MTKYNSDKDLKAIISNEEFKKVKKLRFKFKIIYFISKLINEKSSKIENLKYKTFDAMLSIADKHKKKELKNEVDSLTSYLLDQDNKNGINSKIVYLPQDKESTDYIMSKSLAEKLSNPLVKPCKIEIKEEDKLK